MKTPLKLNNENGAQNKMILISKLLYNFEQIQFISIVHKIHKLISLFISTRVTFEFSLFLGGKYCFVNMPSCFCHHSLTMKFHHSIKKTSNW